MKKFILSAGVLGVFSLYAIHTNFSSDEKVTTITVKTPIASDVPTPVNVSRGKYKDGNYTGSVADAFYGNIQVQAVINGGKITDVIFLQYPSDRSTSRYINSQADPLLAQEAIQIQSANVAGVSGATASSGAFVESLQSALQQAL